MSARFIYSSIGSQVFRKKQENKRSIERVGPLLGGLNGLQFSVGWIV